MHARWPFPGDSPAARARKIALAYRAALEAIDPKTAGELDERFRSWGERWPAPVRSYNDDEWVTADEAGDLIGISGGTISSLRVRGRIDGKFDGKRYLFLVIYVYKLSGDVRGRRSPVRPG